VGLFDLTSPWQSTKYSVAARLMVKVPEGKRWQGVCLTGAASQGFVLRQGGAG